VVIGRGRKGARLCDFLARKGARLCDFLALFRSSYVGWRLYLVCRSAYALFPAWEKERISGPMRLGDKRINRF
jgi:hypothetical protein